VSRTYASVCDLGTCSQVQELNMHPDQILPPTQEEDFDFEEYNDSDSECCETVCDFLAGKVEAARRYARAAGTFSFV